MRSIVAAVASVLLSVGTAAFAAEPARVTVVPFTEADGAQQADWVTRAINQSVVDELSAMPDVTVSTPAVSEVQPNGAPAGQPSTQPAGAANFTVHGTIQRVNQQLRISGNVTDAAGKSVGGFKATGNTEELFAIEDSIAQQLRTTLGIPDRPAAQVPPTGLGNNSKAQPPAVAQPTGSSYDGSDLQHAVQDPTFTRRVSDRSYYNNVSNPTVPAGVVVPNGTVYGPGIAGYGYGGYGYGGYNYPPYYTGGWGWGWGGWGGTGDTVIVVNQGDGGHGHGHDHGGVTGGGGTTTVTTPGPTFTPFVNTNGQAIRAAATGHTGNSFGGQTQMVPAGPTMVPGPSVPSSMGGGRSGSSASSGGGGAAASTGAPGGHR